MKSNRAVRFLYRGRIVEVADAAPARTVLQWLREDERATGTKEGCAEGDCGACTVVLGRLDERGEVALETVNACIRLLPTIDGKALFTVEDLACGGALHPAQQAMVDHHGSQCGFCTPGFVMSLWACYERHQQAGTRPARQQLADDLSGNLCRCTGYRPILDAGQHMFDALPVRLAREPVAAALRSMRTDAPLRLAGGFAAPRTLDELAELVQAQPQARLLAGATDLALTVTKRLGDLGALIYLGEVAELGRVEVGAASLVIGAGASLESAWAALVQEWPELRELWLRFASPAIRHAGTMGGNVANGSPIGDSAPVLMALGAQVVLRQGSRVRAMPLEDFTTGYLSNRLEPGEFVQALQVPRRAGRDQRVGAYKVSKRFDSDISAVCAVLAIEVDGDRISAARLVFGGMAATVKRAARAEAALVGQPWSEAALLAAVSALADDFTPLTDLRASAAYRTQVAGNLLRRFWLRTRSHDALPESALSVWARESAA